MVKPWKDGDRFPKGICHGGCGKPVPAPKGTYKYRWLCDGCRNLIRANAPLPNSPNPRKAR